MPRSRLVLVADDQIDAAEVLALIITLMTGYETVVAADGEQALDLAVKRRPDAVVLDIDMPVLDGLETGRRLRRESAQGAPLLIAATGGSANAANVSEIFNHVLTKPVDVDRLVHLLKMLPA